MIDFRFILNPDSDALEAEEPAGWADIAMEVVRDNRYHGISIAYGLSDLQFTGAAAAYLRDQYETYGIDAKVDVLIAAECDGESQYEELFQIDFGQYEEDLGGSCSVKVGIEQASCFARVAAGMDKKVDLEAAVTFDGTTPTPALPGLKQTVTLPSKTLLKSAEGYVTVDAPAMDGDFSAGVKVFRPVFDNTKFESLKTSQLQAPAVSMVYTGSDIVSPFVLNEEDTRCISGTLNVSMRMKGSVQVIPISGSESIMAVQVVFLRSTGSYFPYPFDESKVIAIQHIVTTATTINEPGPIYGFDLSYANDAFALAPGEGIFGFVMVFTDFNSMTREQVIFHPETFVKIEAKINCPPSEGSLFLPFETFQRVADIVTDGCLKVESEWYGRTEHGYGVDGCGALRSITGGLHLRNAPSPKVFLSMKEALEGYQPVDATGFALERDEEGAEILRVEHVSRFYQDVEILRIDNVPGVRLKVIPNDIPGTVKVGYDKWQAQSVNGLDEFNSTREYRSSVTAATTTVELISKFIAGGYLIELARIQSFAETGAADTAYDNDIFLIQLKRGLSGLEVEQGIPTMADDVFDPPTVYNFRISPVRNLHRWWPWLSGLAFRDAEAGAFNFAAGTGNYNASGFIADACSPEAYLLSESDIVKYEYLKEDFRQPLARAESVTFETTMSLRDFKTLRANPYGYVSFQCGTGEWRKGYITKVSYHVARSTAAFELRSKYE